MNSPTRILSDIDRSRLFEIVDRQQLTGQYPSAQIRGLNRLLNQAQFIDAQEIPADLVTMGSRVRVATNGEEEPREVTLVYPEDARPLEGCLSILTPMAQALLGAHVGQTITWEAPMGLYSAVVEAITYQPEAALHQS